MALLNLGQFTRRVKASEPEMLDLLGKAHRKLALQALTSVVLKTRVKTGRTRNNWQTTLEHPAEGFVEGIGPDAPNPSGAALIAQARGENVIGRAKVFDTIWVANNVPWILNLEDLDHMLDHTVNELRGQFGR